MEKIAIRVKERNNLTRINEPVSFGIPLPEGVVKTVHHLELIDGQKPLSGQFQPIGHWPDSSIRWVHASFLISLNPNSTKDLVLAQRPTPSPPISESVVKQTTESLVIHTSMSIVAVYPNSLEWQVYNRNETGIPSTIVLRDESGVPCTVKAEANWEITHKGPVFVSATLVGEWLKQNNEPLARFVCELRIFLETGLVQVELTTHNPKRARHPGGLWDLGDPGAVYFRELAVETTLRGTSRAQVIPQATKTAPEIFNFTDFNLYQDSSGGKNWQSRNHIDSTGEVSTRFCGYRLSSSSELLEEGERANPLVSIEHDCGQLDVAVPDFWQNFPTSVRKEGNSLTIGLFPKDARNAYELQGGEQKTLRCLMVHSPDCNKNGTLATAYTPLVPVLTPECYEQAEAFPWFKANAQPGALDELIAEGLNGSSNFFAKREVIDEFGWRNFGDIFADHETLYQKEGEPSFISHYNNQYDPLYGFARQFALTGDGRWFQLMDDLARHIVDIDIYHTNEDRAEYNNGLFWHTDHYLDAHTATHRTFSRFNDSSSTPDQTGGGPAEEHCYSTGLLYHYQLTGNKKSRQAVLDLAQWMTTLHEGQGGFLEQMLALKKREIRTFKKMVQGQRVTTHRYPFTRGTGNYLNTLLDAWIIDEHGPWLKRAEALIRNTIHPVDNIEQRNLLNVETGWSYLILLASLFRYLYLKSQIDSEDEQYKYTKESLLHYTHWMRENERSFLADEAQLEFANDTWVAQDIRKAMIMFQAAEIDHENASQYHKTGQKWLGEVMRTLQSSQEANLTRVLVILMQNYGPHTSIISKPLTNESGSSLPSDWAAPVLTWRLLASRIVTRAIRALSTFRPSRERHWLNTRLDRS